MILNGPKSNQMDTGFLDRLASQLKCEKSAACRRAIQRLLAFMKERCELGEFESHTEAEAEFRRLVDAEEGCGGNQV